MTVSAGVLPFRRSSGKIEVLIAHPGGPFWARRHRGAWSIVKGELDPGEDPEAAARREFEEETGWSLPDGPWIPLGRVVQRSGKEVLAWAVEADFDPATLRPGTFTLGGRAYPEIDRVEWCGPDEARTLLNPAQAAFVDRLLEQIEPG